MGTDSRPSGPPAFGCASVEHPLMPRVAQLVVGARVPVNGLQGRRPAVTTGRCAFVGGADTDHGHGLDRARARPRPRSAGDATGDDHNHRPQDAERDSAAHLLNRASNRLVRRTIRPESAQVTAASASCRAEVGAHQETGLAPDRSRQRVSAARAAAPGCARPVQHQLSTP